MFWIVKRQYPEARDIPAHWLWLVISERWLREIGHNRGSWFETFPPERLESVTAEEAIAAFAEDPSGVIVVGEMTEEMEKFVSSVRALGYNVHL